MKKLIANILGYLLLLIFGKSALKQFDKQVLSIYFHDPSLFLFKGIIGFLLSKGFRFISEEEYFQIINGEKDVEGRTAFVSFDDGWKGNLKLIPILEKYQIPATFFIPVRPVMTGNFWWEYVAKVVEENKELKSVEELKKLPNARRMQLIRGAAVRYDLKRSCIELSELKRLNENPLITIGSHTYHHPITIKCSDEELDFEYRESKKTLEEWLSVEINSFSFPNGDYNQRDLALLKKYNYKMAFTVNPELNSNFISEFQIPRVSINSNGGKYENIARMLRVWHKFVQPLQQKQSMLFNPKLSGS
ncbi:polysaccharide deacetylase family protein [Marinifilum sp. D714]|uniref:polysaccharide deacetylase family protein n=1 Tax=Marinifilum sp. D714 TaxID=2937523 RepID=UPI0027CB1EA7|nr:polysaccharide deacetylase family protein [Marinifilum sp. D714]MDQ2178490.1 polysaccharide deacetylase family protein [Marinifilum sp. D714]